MKPCYYKVASMCGSHDVGDILEAYEVCRETTDQGERRALILLPDDKLSSASMVICRQIGTRKRKRLWEEVNDDSFLNLTKKQAKQIGQANA